MGTRIHLRDWVVPLCYLAVTYALFAVIYACGPYMFLLGLYIVITLPTSVLAAFADSVGCKSDACQMFMLLGLPPVNVAVMWAIVSGWLRVRRWLRGV